MTEPTKVIFKHEGNNRGPVWLKDGDPTNPYDGSKIPTNLETRWMTLTQAKKFAKLRGLPLLQV